MEEQLEKQVATLQELVDALKTVLVFYAAKDNYTSDMKWIHGNVAHDMGRLARAALGQEAPDFVSGFIGPKTRRYYHALGIDIRTHDKEADRRIAARRHTGEAINATI